jgi:hypothetical protein
MKITQVRAVSHKVGNVMTGRKTSLGGHLELAPDSRYSRGFTEGKLLSAL